LVAVLGSTTTALSVDQGQDAEATEDEGDKGGLEHGE